MNDTLEHGSTSPDDNNSTMSNKLLDVVETNDSDLDIDEVNSNIKRINRNSENKQTLVNAWLDSLPTKCQPHYELTQQDTLMKDNNVTDVKNTECTKNKEDGSQDKLPPSSVHASVYSINGPMDQEQFPPSTSAVNVNTNTNNFSKEQKRKVIAKVLGKLTEIVLDTHMYE